MTWDPLEGCVTDFRSIVAPDVADAYRSAGWWTDETYAERVRSWARDRPQRPAYITDGGRVSWHQVDRATDRLAGCLVGAGLQPGERAAVLLPDGPTIHIAFLAAERAGVTVVGIGMRAGDREIRHLLTKTGAVALVSHPDYRDRPVRERFEDWRTAGTSLRLLVEVPRLDADLDAALVVNGGTVRRRQSDEADPGGRAIGPDDLFLVNSTSGTTGLPKCVTHTQNRWRYVHQQAVANGRLADDEVILSAIPTPFGFGVWTSHVTPILLGAPVVLCERFYADKTLELIERERVTMLCCVSSQFLMLLNSPDIARRDLSSLRVMFTGGETVPYERALAFERVTGATVLQFYGSNETGLLSGTTVDDGPERRLRSAGCVNVDMNVRLFDDGVDVTRTGRGQPACRGPATSAGYLDDAQANRQLFTRDGWMLMGDICTLDQDGYLSVVGRTSDFIIRGGKNISAAQVEAEASTHPAVALAAAVPVSDPILGERVCLYVELRSGWSSLTLDELVAHLDDRGVGRETFPERLVVVDRLPTSSGGKVAKGELQRPIVEPWTASL